MFIHKKIVVICGLIIIFAVIFISTYALEPDLFTRSVTAKILQIDEASYGKLYFDSSNLDFRPILDNLVDTNDSNVIHIEFMVGGSRFNNVDNIVYDIALVDLEVDCSLISPYVKWKLKKNGVVISVGSLDYQFDTIVDGRLVLTSIQQDLISYSDDKTVYDNYDFYMWLSDSCQSENIMDCLASEDQSYLLGKKIHGKVEVELYAETKKALVRKPSEVLDTKCCVVGSDGEIYVNG